MTIDDDDQVLLDAAMAVRKNSASPYSNFAVGAAVRTKSGRIFVGTNVESSSLGLTICAERAALCAAVAAGEPHIVEVAVVADTKVPVPPCGACRQLLHDFGPEARLILSNLSNQIQHTTMPEILPYAFSASMLPDS